MAAKGTIFDIKKFAIHDGPGIRTTVFFTGCPMDCWWCHNPEARNGDTGKLTEKTRTVTVSEVVEQVEKDRIFYDQSGGGVTFSGGEPLAQPDFLYSLLDACRERGFHTVVDTCGYAPMEDFDRIYDLTDLFLFDVKIMDSDSHTKYTGVSNGLVLENLRRLVKKGPKVQIRIPLIPGITDTEENIESVISLLANLPGINGISLLPYNRFGEDKRRRFKLDDRLGSLPTQPRVDVEAFAARFSSQGYDVKIGG